MRRSWWWWLALAGCDRVLGLHAFPDAAPDAPPCVTPFVHDSFDQAPPCSTWGHSYGDNAGTTVSVANGQLVIQPGANAVTTSGGCGSNGDVTFDSGVFLQVTTLPAGYEYMLAAATWADGTSQQISWSSTAVAFVHDKTTLNQIPFDPMSTTWVRMRPSPDGTATIAETSGDGLHWQMFATDPVAPPATVGINLVAGVFAAEAAPAPVKFDALNVCP